MGCDLKCIEGSVVRIYYLHSWDWRVFYCFIVLMWVGKWSYCTSTFTKWCNMPLSHANASHNSFGFFCSVRLDLSFVYSGKCSSASAADTCPVSSVFFCLFFLLHTVVTWREVLLRNVLTFTVTCYNYHWHLKSFSMTLQRRVPSLT